MRNPQNYTITIVRNHPEPASAQSSKSIVCMYFQVPSLEVALAICRGALQVVLSQVSTFCYCVISDGSKRIGRYFLDSLQNTFIFKSDIG